MAESFSYGMLFGGIGLFLLGMILMSDGLRSASGPALTRILEKGTDTKIKGFFSGLIATAILQSSTTTTLLTIGFVNAGLLTFAHSLWLIFGANVGSTAAGWLVALIGLKVKVDVFALPIIGVGAAMRILGKNKRWGTFGDIFAGFGMLFLGLSFIQGSFSNVSDYVDFMTYSGKGIFSVLAFLVAGFILTVLMQSSSASIAVIMTLAMTAGLPLTEAASAVIGANIGTTMTALFAAIGATANAKRAASAHMLFSVITGLVAIVILPIMLMFLEWLRNALHLEDSAATELALFHTVFNLFGVLLMIPLSDHLAMILGRFFTSNEAEVKKPKYIDNTLLGAPALAVEALKKELDRYRDLLVGSLRGFIGYLQGNASILPKINKIDELDEAIVEFINKLNKSSMSGGTAASLTECLLIRDQYGKSMDYLKRLISEYREPLELDQNISKKLKKYLREVDSLLEQIDTPIGAKPRSLSEKKLDEFDRDYTAFKQSMIKSAIGESVNIRDMEGVNNLARGIRRMLHSFAKAQKIIFRSEPHI